MSRHLLGSPEETNTLRSMHGVGTNGPSTVQNEARAHRRKTPIIVPRDGDTGLQASSSHHRNTYSNRKRSSRAHESIPKHKFTFSDNLRSEARPGDIVPGPSIGESKLATARRPGDSKSKRTPSPHPPQHATKNNSSSGVTVDLTADSRLDKGKGKARENVPEPIRTTRSRSRHSNTQQEAINLTSSDDENEVQHVPERLTKNRMSTRQTDAASTSLALQRKDERRKTHAASSSAASPNTFYADKNQRSAGPIRVEEPVSRSRSYYVEDTPEPDTPPLPAMSRASSGKTSSMVERMKPRNPSPNASAISQRSSNGSSNKIQPSPSRSPQSLENREHDRTSHAVDRSGSSHPHKRKRLEDSHSVPKWSSNSEPFQPLELHPDAIVVSDIWRSQKGAQAVVLFHRHNIKLGLAPDNWVHIRYNDIAKVNASKREVEYHATIGLVLRPGSDSAQRVQEYFPEFDPRASGHAAEIQLIVMHSNGDLEAHRRAVALLREKLRPGQVPFEFLLQSGASSKVQLVVDSVKSGPWPPQASSPPKQRAARTLIKPGDGRTPQSDARDNTRAGFSYSPPQHKMKAFNIQPASPQSAAGGTVDTHMVDARSRSRSPQLGSLIVSKGKLTTNTRSDAETRTQTRRSGAAASHDPILRYPYEGSGAVTLLESDFDRLMDGQLLNDTVIEFGLTFIFEKIREQKPELADSIHVFNTYFYKFLSATTVEEGYRKLRRWTSKVDLFTKKYIVVPINEDYHWYLALIVNPGFLLMDQEKDSGSEQDQEEVASALTVAPKTSPTAPASSESVYQARDARHENPSEVTSRASSEPGTPPLPPLGLPPRSIIKVRASVPMDVDGDLDARDSPPAKSSSVAANLNQTFIITFDSLGNRHVKVRNKLHEYLWREALDKKQEFPSLLAEMTKAREAAQREAEKPQTRLSEATSKDPEEADDDVTMIEASDDNKHGRKHDLQEAGLSRKDGIRLVGVTDTRQVAKDDSTKSLDAVSAAKALPTTQYIDAQVPTQPNFCDCGIYLLHYVARFFENPNWFLKLIVEDKELRTKHNKSAPSVREKLKSESKDSVESHWQAGEVSGKRAYWRDQVTQLSERWRAYEKQKAEQLEKAAAAEGTAVKQDQSESKEQKADGKQQAMSNGSTPARAQAADDSDVPMPLADQAQSSAAEKSKQPEQQSEAVERQVAVAHAANGLRPTAAESDALGQTLGGEPNEIVRGIIDQAEAKILDSKSQEILQTRHQNAELAGSQSRPSQQQPAPSPFGGLETTFGETPEPNLPLAVPDSDPNFPIPMSWAKPPPSTTAESQSEQPNHAQTSPTISLASLASPTHQRIAAASPPPPPAEPSSFGSSIRIAWGELEASLPRSSKDSMDRKEDAKDESNNDDEDSSASETDTVILLRSPTPRAY